MKIYFVRHGQSEGNAGDTVQHNDEALTEKGMRQAEFVAKRLESLSIDHIFASTSERAKRTAEIINKSLRKPIEFTDLLKERQLPTLLIGKQKNAPEVHAARQEIWDRMHESEWRHSDEENLLDLKVRARKCFDLFASSGKENILAVTHGIFLRTLLTFVIMGENFTADELRKFMLGFASSNTGVTILEHTDSYMEGRNPLRWQVRTWNDYAHIENA